MDGAIGIHGDEGQVDICARHAGKLNLCLFGCFLEPLLCHTVIAQVDTVGLLEFIRDIIHDPLIEVIAAETVIACGRKNFEYAVADLKDGYIEGTAAEIVNENLLVGFLIHTVCKSCCGGFIDDTEDVKACNLACILGCLTLAVAEICRNGDDCIGHGLAEICFRILLQLLKNHCGDLLRSIALALDSAAVVGAHLTLDRGYGVVGVGYSLTLCNLTDHALAALECNNGRGRAGAFGIGDDDGFTALKHCNTGIGSTKVNTDNL